MRVGVVIGGTAEDDAAAFLDAAARAGEGEVVGLRPMAAFQSLEAWCRFAVADGTASQAGPTSQRG